MPNENSWHMAIGRSPGLESELLLQQLYCFWYSRQLAGNSTTCTLQQQRCTDAQYIFTVLLFSTVTLTVICVFHFSVHVILKPFNILFSKQLTYLFGHSVVFQDLIIVGSLKAQNKVMFPVPKPREV